MLLLLIAVLWVAITGKLPLTRSHTLVGKEAWLTILFTFVTQLVIAVFLWKYPLQNISLQLVALFAVPAICVKQFEGLAREGQ